MPTLTETNVRHLLRRTEFSDRTSRVQELLALGSIEAAVDNVLDVDSADSDLTFTETEEWQRQQEFVNWWLDEMAHGSRRPFRERLALWWHTHFATSFEKVNWAIGMREQIELFRRDGLGNLRDLTIEMSLQPAMLRYLDNNQNRASSPNQNFARELMELFVLGVGNYTEPDVEAATAAWTGHTDQWDDKVSPYRWRPEWHDGSTKQYLGRTINAGGDGRDHGPETIRVMLGNGIVPAGAASTANRGRETRRVAAEFLSRKLWMHFASGEPSNAVVSELASVLVGADFEIRPWVRALLTHDEFYTASTRDGLVRNPTEYVVALMRATGVEADRAPVWLMPAMGQRLLFAPNVAGWKTNDYWVNPSAMEARARAAYTFYWRVAENYWASDDSGWVELAGGRLQRSAVVARNDNRTRTMSDEELIDRLLGLTDLRIDPRTAAAIIEYSANRNVWERIKALVVLFLSPENHLA